VPVIRSMLSSSDSLRTTPIALDAGGHKVEASKNVRTTGAPAAR
jgi:hypothetical protein